MLFALFQSNERSRVEAQVGIGKHQESFALAVDLYIPFTRYRRQRRQSGGGQGA